MSKAQPEVVKSVSDYIWQLNEGDQSLQTTVAFDCMNPSKIQSVSDRSMAFNTRSDVLNVLITTRWDGHRLDKSNAVRERSNAIVNLIASFQGTAEVESKTRSYSNYGEYRTIRNLNNISEDFFFFQLEMNP